VHASTPTPTGPKNRCTGQQNGSQSNDIQAQSAADTGRGAE